MGFTMADLKRMRESREARIAANKASLTNTDREYLLTSHLPKGVKLWYPQKDKPEEVVMRIVDFMTTKENNVAGNPVGTFDAFRRVRVHKLADGRMVVCPTSYGRKCPLCDKVAEHYDDIKNDRNSPWAKLKPRKLLLFNMLVKVADESGKTKLVPRVFRGTEFYFMDVFNTALTTEEQFAPTMADKIYNFSDLDTGYWMEARFGMAPSVKANPQSKPIMQLLSLHPRYKDEAKAIPEAFYPYIADLDELIPDAPSYAELARFVDDAPMPDTTAEPEKQKAPSTKEELDEAAKKAIEYAEEHHPELIEKANAALEKSFGPVSEEAKPTVEAMPQNPSGFGEEVADEDFDLGDFDIG